MSVTVSLHEALLSDDPDESILTALSMETERGLGRSAAEVHAFLTGEPVGVGLLGQRRPVAWFMDRLDRLVDAGAAVAYVAESRGDRVYEPTVLRSVRLNAHMQRKYRTTKRTWSVDAAVESVCGGSAA